MKKIDNNFIEKYFFVEKILTIIDFIYEDGEKKLNKSITEFNPADNHYYNGYIKACEIIRKNICRSILEEEKNENYNI